MFRIGDAVQERVARVRGHDESGPYGRVPAGVDGGYDQAGDSEDGMVDAPRGLGDGRLGGGGLGGGRLRDRGLRDRQLRGGSHAANWSCGKGSKARALVRSRVVDPEGAIIEGIETPW